MQEDRLVYATVYYAPHAQRVRLELHAAAPSAAQASTALVAVPSAAQADEEQLSLVE